jgi:hypothetical protein
MGDGGRIGKARTLSRSPQWGGGWGKGGVEWRA